MTESFSIYRALDETPSTSQEEIILTQRHSQNMKSSRAKNPENFKSNSDHLRSIMNLKDEYQPQEEYLRNLKVYGYLFLIVTWILFIFAMGTIFNLWQWCFNENNILIDYLKSIYWINILLDDIKDQNKIVDNYYIYIFFLNFVILWIWAVVSWISMKLFRHSKGGGS